MSGTKVNTCAACGASWTGTGGHTCRNQSPNAALLPRGTSRSGRR